MLRDSALPAPLERYPESALTDPAADATRRELRAAYHRALDDLGPDAVGELQAWPARVQAVRAATHAYPVRDRSITGANYVETLSHNRVPKIAAPAFGGWGEILGFVLHENLPGAYPYTAGVYPYRREQEDPIRMFAGEGAPERTNRRFHYLARGQAATRLSTAFDSTTLYGEDPDTRPDVYGRTGNSGVSIATLDDMKKLYSGFDLCAPDDLGLDDHQRPGADDPRDVHEHGHRPARRTLAEGARGAGTPRRRASRSCTPRCAPPATSRRPIAARCPRATTARGSPCSACTRGSWSSRACSEPGEHAQLRADGADARARHRAGRHPQGGPGAEHLHLLDRVRAADDGRRAAVLRRARRAQLLFRLDLRLSHRRGRREPGEPARLHARQRLHDRRVLPRARHASRRLRAEPVVLLLQRHGRGIRGDRPRRAPHLGARDARALWRRAARPDAEVPHPDLGTLAACARDPVQRHPHHAAGALCAVRQLQQPAHERLRRGADHARPRRACVARSRSSWSSTANWA